MKNRVWQAVVIYVPAAFVFLEAANLVVDNLGLPAWLMPALIVAAAAGLPIAVAIGWATSKVESGSLANLGNRGRIVVGAAALLSGGLGLGYWIASGRNLALQPHASGQRVLVLPFENRANDPLLDEMALAELTTEWIASGLGRAGFDVVPMAFTASLTTDERLTPVLAADRTGAAIIATGAVMRRGDSVLVIPEILDGEDGRLLYAIEPAAASAERAMDALETSLERASGAIASFQDRPELAAAVSPPPSLEAHRTLVEIDRLFERERFDDVISLSLAAYEADTTYLQPLTRAAWAAHNMGYGELADSLVTLIRARRSRLNRLERADQAFLGAMRSGDREATYIAGRELAELDPTQWMLPSLGARNTLRFEEAVAYSARFDPTVEWNRLEAYEWASWQAPALHALERYEDELDAYRRAAELDPEQYRLISETVAPLIALGHLQEVRRLMSEFEVQPRVQARFSWSPGTALLLVAREARAHGHADLAAEAATRARRYYESAQTQSELGGIQSRPWRARYATSLYYLGEFEEALDLFRGLEAEMPGSYLGNVGRASAALGRVAEAEAVLDSLPVLQSPAATRRDQARILAVLGRTDEAVAHMAQAFRSGLGWSLSVHNDWDLHHLRDEPSYRALIAPR